METKFQTSFIPKKPIMPEGPRHTPAATSILMLLGILVFVASLAGAVGTFFVKAYLETSQTQYKVDLANNEKRFNAPLIAELSRANTKIDLAKQLLKNHLAVSEALTIVAALTADKVYFTSFDFSAPDDFGNGAAESSTFKIKMNGVADSFNSIAFQSDVFGKSQKYGTNKILKNPILSNLSVDGDGNVKFNFSGELQLADISYEKVLNATLQDEGTLPPPTTTN